MNLNEINNSGIAALKPLVKITDSVPDKQFTIIKLKIVNTKYGESVLVELEEVSRFLPKCATSVFKNEIDKFVLRKYVIIFKGSAASSNSGFPDLVKFEIVNL